MSDVHLFIDNVDKTYGSSTNSVKAVHGLSMQVREQEIVALLGSSGCGKTSTLRMIAGFEEVTSGSISLRQRAIHSLAPVKRNVAMAFEGYSLYPPLTVRDNIGFALKAAKLSSAAISEQVNSIASMLEISDILDRYPSSISGGQQQRASLARALVRDADLHLLDEPMGQLEPQLRAVLRGRIKRYIKQRGLTAILVTHDQAEANALADRIAVMEDGYLQQFESPERLKEHPANRFTATFIGEPPMNVLPAKVAVVGDAIHFNLADEVSLSYLVKDFQPSVVEAAVAKKQLSIGFRPYALRRSDKGIEVPVLANQWLGDQTHIVTQVAGMSVILVEHDRAREKIGEQISVSLALEHMHLFDAENGRAIAHGASLAS